MRPPSPLQSGDMVVATSRDPQNVPMAFEAVEGCTERLLAVPLGRVGRDAESAPIDEENVFGSLHVTRAVLPHMQEWRSGHDATKLAVEGLSEAVSRAARKLKDLQSKFEIWRLLTLSTEISS